MNRRRAMMIQGHRTQEIEEMEYLVKEKLYEYTLPQGSMDRVINTGVTWGELKKYKRFAFGIRPKVNVSLQNWYVNMGGRILSRSSGRGLYVEMRNMGSVLEAIFSRGNGVIFWQPYITIDNNEAVYHEASSSRYLLDCSVYNDEDNIIFNVPSTDNGTTTEYTFWVCGLTKKM